jgi:hypothetical protein
MRKQFAKDKVQVNLIINNRAAGNAPLIAQKIAGRLHSQKQRKLFYALPHLKKLPAEFPPHPNHTF